MLKLTIGANVPAVCHLNTAEVSSSRQDELIFGIAYRGQPDIRTCSSASNRNGLIRNLNDICTGQIFNGQLVQHIDLLRHLTLERNVLQSCAAAGDMDRTISCIGIGTSAGIALKGVTVHSDSTAIGKDRTASGVLVSGRQIVLEHSVCANQCNISGRCAQEDRCTVFAFVADIFTVLISKLTADPNCTAVRIGAAQPGFIAVKFCIPAFNSSIRVDPDCTAGTLGLVVNKLCIVNCDRCVGLYIQSRTGCAGQCILHDCIVFQHQLSTGIDSYGSAADSVDRCSIHSDSVNGQVAVNSEQVAFEIRTSGDGQGLTLCVANGNSLIYHNTGCNIDIIQNPDLCRIFQGIGKCNGLFQIWEILSGFARKDADRIYLLQNAVFNVPAFSHCDVFTGCLKFRSRGFTLGQDLSGFVCLGRKGDHIADTKAVDCDRCTGIGLVNMYAS